MSTTRILVAAVWVLLCSASAQALDSDLGTIDLQVERKPDVTMTLFWSGMHPYLKQGAHSYKHSQMAEYPQKFYIDLVKKYLGEEPSGEFYFRFHIYRCVWDGRRCDEEDDFHADKKLLFDVFYDFDS